MDDSSPLILGLSGSLRNSRFGSGSRALVTQLMGCKTQSEMTALLRDEGAFCVREFIDAGRNKGLSFDEIYRNYQRRRGERGLSNTEVALAAGLWGAMCSGARVEHLSLESVFGDKARLAQLDELREKLLRASGVLLSGPVYFGDRGSLAEDFIHFVRTDSELRQHLQSLSVKKAYAGISVGAKRNGGQETNLIYQMLDMAVSGFLAVGNDARSTSQYGGTGWAGDVGTMAEDGYGLETAIGAGRRLGEVTALIGAGQAVAARRKPKIAVWILQDKDQIARNAIENSLFHDSIREKAEIGIFDFTGQAPRRCIACDICPTESGPDEVYRCVIKSPDDLFSNFHQDLLGFDGIVIAGYSAQDTSKVCSVYQRFIERTRYLRRGDYALSNALVMPLVFEEVGARDSLNLRMLTSMIRHHTILTKPVTVNIWQGECLNIGQASDGVLEFIADCCSLVAGKDQLQNGPGLSEYNPVGYEISAEKLRQHSGKKQPKDITVLQPG